jgi:hypothetical protein
MLIWIVLACLLVAMVAGVRYYDRHFFHELFILGAAACIGILIMALIALPLVRMGAYSGIAEFEETRATYERARSAGVGIESAAIQTDIAKANRWLASAQYWNGTIFDHFIPDEVMNLEPIR